MKRARLQFGLFSLLTFMAIVALALGWALDHNRLQSEVQQLKLERAMLQRTRYDRAAHRLRSFATRHGGKVEKAPMWINLEGCPVGDEQLSEIDADLQLLDRWMSGWSTPVPRLLGLYDTHVSPATVEQLRRSAPGWRIETTRPLTRADHKLKKP